MTIEKLYEIYRQNPSVETDTRKLRQGDIFFALKGPNFNGNSYALQALEQGASFAVIDEDLAAANSRLIRVPDVLEALQQLALHHRRQLDIPFIAITGSNGKTTTKELIHTVLAARFRTYTTKGNLNNHIGVPLTILSVKSDAEMAVIEMGANHQREIAGYCSYTLPTHGVITNVGKAHLEGFGGPEGVRKGKGELYDFLREHDGTAFVMWDYDYLREMSTGIKHIVTYGTHDASVEGHAVHEGSMGAGGGHFLQVDITAGAAAGRIQTQLVGDYNLPNVLVAVTIGKHFGVPEESIRKAIEAYTPSNSRSQLIEREGNHIILDAYNANPSSMKAAIENFAALTVPEGKNGGKILVLGAMAELGTGSQDEHRQIVKLIGQYPWKDVLLVGGDFQRIDHPYLRFDSAVEAGNWLKKAGLRDAYLLVKGSRSMKMEEALLP